MPNFLNTFAVGFRALALLCLCAGAAQAEALPKPTGPILLSVTGAIGVTNAEGGATFDLAMLEAIGKTTTVTSTAWTEGESTFEGVLLSDLMERVGATGTTAVAVALNDYKVDIPAEDFTNYPVILA